MTSSEQIEAELERQDDMVPEIHPNVAWVYPSHFEEFRREFDRRGVLIRALMAEREAGMAFDDSGEFAMALVDKVIETQTATDAAIEDFIAPEPK